MITQAAHVLLHLSTQRLVSNPTQCGARCVAKPWAQRHAHLIYHHSHHTRKPLTAAYSITPGESPTPSAPALSLFSKAQALRYENIPSQLRSGGALLPSVSILAPPSPFETDIFRPHRSRLKTFFIADARVVFPVRPNQHAHNECRQSVCLGSYEDKIVNHPIHVLQQAELGNFDAELESGLAQ